MLIKFTLMQYVFIYSKEHCNIYAILHLIRNQQTYEIYKPFEIVFFFKFNRLFVAR